MNIITTPITRLSIVMKVSLLVGSVAAIASFIVGSLIINGSSNIVYENALSQLKYETNIKSLKLVSDIKNLSEDANYLVGTPPIQGIPRTIFNQGIDPDDNSDLKTWKSRLSIIFTELIRAKPNYLQIRYIGIEEGGKEILRVNRRGKLIETVSDKELQRKGQSQYFKNATSINPGEVYFSNISLNREFNKVSIPHTPVIRAASPVFYNNNLFGILVINMEFGEIFEDLIKKTPRSLKPYVINEQGYFLAHPDRSMTYGFDLGKENKITAVYDNFSLQKSKDFRDKEFTVESNGDVVHVVKAFFDPARKNRHFAVILATSYKSLQSGSDDLRFQSYIIIGVLVTLSLIAAGYFSSRLMNPLRLVTKAAKDFAKGKQVSNLPTQYRDEIGELARSFDDMRHQLEDKEKELIISQGKVHHANKLASLGEMAASMAHEINSPIQAISLTAQRVQRQIKKGKNLDDIDDSMKKITSSVLKISDIIDSLRKISRDSTQDDFVPVKIKDLVQDASNMTTERFSVNNVDFEIVFNDVSQNQEVQCQHLQIGQVLINLLNNAYDAVVASASNEDRWIKLEFRISKMRTLCISVLNGGEAISHSIVDKIFDPMFTTKDVGKGTGLGLSISREIAIKHGGQLTVNLDAPNTCFVLELPLTQSTS